MCGRREKLDRSSPDFLCAMFIVAPKGDAMVALDLGDSISGNEIWA